MANYDNRKVTLQIISVDKPLLQLSYTHVGERSYVDIGNHLPEN